MKRLISKSLLIIVSCCFSVFVTVADFSFSNFTNSSIAFSSEQSESDSTYILELSIKGVDTNKVLLESTGQQLVVLITNGNTVNGAIAGGQVIRYTYSFASDAKLKQRVRKNFKDGIKITIPKR